MADRTVTISSAAKMFNCTGWKIGWACGRPELVAGVRATKQYLSYVGGAPFQPAVACALDNEDAWVDGLQDSLQSKRDKLAAAPDEYRFRGPRQFRHLGFCAPIRPAPDSTTAPGFCERRLPVQTGVAAIPMTAFCGQAGPRIVETRCFAFCKRDETLDEAIRRLETSASSRSLRSASTVHAVGAAPASRSRRCRPYRLSRVGGMTSGGPVAAGTADTRRQGPAPRRYHTAPRPTVPVASPARAAPPLPPAAHTPTTLRSRHHRRSRRWTSAHQWQEPPSRRHRCRSTCPPPIPPATATPGHDGGHPRRHRRCRRCRHRSG